MSGGVRRIGVAAPSSRLAPEMAEASLALARAEFPEAELVFHPQCFLSHGHFAGTDAERARAFLDLANDDSLDAVWFGRGGYGSCRIAGEVIDGLGLAARDKVYLGYSDAGTLLAGLYRAGCARVAHGPMPADIAREGGAAAVRRAMAWMTRAEKTAVEPHALSGAPCAAFNITILSHLLGTAMEPDLRGHVLMLEEVSEAMYRIDRAFWHIVSTPALAGIAGIRLGRCSLIPPNDPDFGMSEEEVATAWCARAGIPYLGRADIGHDVDNKIVPFGRSRAQGAV